MWKKYNQYVIGLLIIAFVVAMMAFVVYPGIRQTPRAECMKNFKDMMTAISIYSSQYGGRMPLSSNWCDYLIEKDYARAVEDFVCPEARPTDEQVAKLKSGSGPLVPIGYSYYEPLSGRLTTLMVDGEKTPVLFDSSKIERNSSAGLDSLAFRHLYGTANIAFADGHADSYNTEPELPDGLFKKAEDEEF